MQGGHGGLSGQTGFLTMYFIALHPVHLLKFQQTRAILTSVPHRVWSDKIRPLPHITKVNVEVQIRQQERFRLNDFTQVNRQMVLYCVLEDLVGCLHGPWRRQMLLPCTAPVSCVPLKPCIPPSEHHSLSLLRESYDRPCPPRCAQIPVDPRLPLFPNILLHVPPQKRQTITKHAMCWSPGPVLLRATGDVLRLCMCAPRDDACLKSLAFLSPPFFSPLYPFLSPPFPRYRRQKSHT